MPVDLKWTGDEIPDELAESFHQANEVLGRAFQGEITANKWQWPRGQSPRDIVDEGALRQSYAGERGRQGTDPVFDHSWNMEYAMAVHEGAVLSSGTILPGRPWTEDPLRNAVLQKAFERLAQARLQ